MLFNLLIARFISIEDYGMLSFSDTIVSFIIVLGGVGLHTIGIRDVSQQKKSLEYIYSNIVAIRTILVAFFGLGIFLLLFKGYRVPFLIYTYLFTICQVMLIDWFYIAIDKKRKLATAFFIAIVSLFIGIGTLYLRDDFTISTIRFVQLISLFLASSYLVLNSNKLFSYRFISRNSVISYMKDGYPLVSAYLFQQSYYLGIPLAIVSFVGFKEQGYFAVGSRLAFVFVTLRNLLIQPLSKYIYTLSYKKYIKLHNRYLPFLIGLAICFYFVVSYFDETLINLLFGDKYLVNEVFVVFRIMMLLPIIYFLFIGHATIFTANGNQSVYAKLCFCSFLMFMLSLFVIIMFSLHNVIIYAGLFVAVELFIFLGLDFNIRKK
ncbi:MAG: hypothetical protein WBG43_06320 [Marinifilaceae bacterium]